MQEVEHHGNDRSQKYYQELQREEVQQGNQQV
jgi:hypothetical protein